MLPPSKIEAAAVQVLLLPPVRVLNQELENHILRCSPRRRIYEEQGGQNSSSDFSLDYFKVMSNLFWWFWEHTIGLICSDRCQTSQINCFLSS